MEAALNIVMMILSVMLIAVILLQTQGSSFTGAFGGGDSGSINRTRRGFEKTLFQATIGLAVVWTLMAIAASFAA